MFVDLRASRRMVRSSALRERPSLRCIVRFPWTGTVRIVEMVSRVVRCVMSESSTAAIMADGQFTRVRIGMLLSGGLHKGRLAGRPIAQSKIEMRRLQAAGSSILHNVRLALDLARPPEFSQAPRECFPENARRASSPPPRGEGGAEGHKPGSLDALWVKCAGVERGNGDVQEDVDVPTLSNDPHGLVHELSQVWRRR